MRLPRLVVVSVLLMGACAGEGRPGPVDGPRGEMALAVDDYTNCLQDEGIEVDPPRFDARGRVAGWPQVSDHIDPDDLETAQAACRDIISKVAFPDVAPDDSAWMKAAFEFVDCMRAEGVDVPDPTAQGLVFEDVDTKSRRFGAAEKVCQPIMEAVN